MIRIRQKLRRLPRRARAIADLECLALLTGFEVHLDKILSSLG
jgi:hypothetical protein